MDTQKKKKKIVITVIIRLNKNLRRKWSERLTAISRDISPRERERASERIKADHSLSLGAAAL